MTVRSRIKLSQEKAGDGKCFERSGRYKQKDVPQDVFYKIFQLTELVLP